MSEMIAHGNGDHPCTQRTIGRRLRDIDFVAAAGMPIGVHDGNGFAPQAQLDIRRQGTIHPLDRKAFLPYIGNRSLH
jgi:hypothetical protein